MNSNSHPLYDRTSPSCRSVEANHHSIEAACEHACKAIAPAWPLDRAIAVNPHWERVSQPVRRVAARMAVLGSIQVLPTRQYIEQALGEGRIGTADLAFALATSPSAQAAGLTPQACKQALAEKAAVSPLPLLIDLLDNDPLSHKRLSWRQAITHQVSQTCAAFFDEHQADWQPSRKKGLYAFWCDTLTHDHGIGILMGLPNLGRSIGALPATRAEAEQWVLQRLGLPEAVWADYLEAVLLTVNGWASWCAYLGWQARLQDGKTDPNLRDLLAIRLAWGAILLDCKDDAAAHQAFATLQAAWRQASAMLESAHDALLIDEVWQIALEAGYQRQLSRKLLSVGPPAAEAQSSQAVKVEVQAAFCIDVRSEPMRRSLEAVWPAIQTIGFAGFFGLPAAYTPLATHARRPQLPGLLEPTVEVVDSIIPGSGARPDEDEHERKLTIAARAARERWFARTGQWLAASRWPGAAFSYVEAAGLGYVGKLFGWLSPSTQARPRDDLAGLPNRYRPMCRPGLTGLDVDARVALAAGVLHAMGLDHDLAPLVLLVGHGSHTTNNAHTAGLDCGACCGQTGEVNARALAQLLNDLAVRAGLQSSGIAVPVQTVFVAALHNTTTDEFEGFDLDLLPASAEDGWHRLQKIFAHAGDQVRRERATGLGLNPRMPHYELLTALRRRANDGAQTRPEWGLANNASFVIAPRWRTLGAALDGRSFLHDYDAANDADGSVLELLMTAPMLVTHWINWQYHASTCDSERLGSGNKVLHNVVGGNLGVFEGNGGDLRIGLSKQSLHDGTRWMHEPLRLTVIIDAPAQAIERVVQKHAVVRHLVYNGWLHLWRFDQARLASFQCGGWQPLPYEPS
ncbi:DUF2309 domain-containing protein [Variovorax sp. LG9.2]|uniref:YbcC family protein n=1 Tax=Variovorax sp. LG9.2 TaxID=3048626 RepID=UPI002B235F22|nr:DUF2309 domain-containing protein [Variovorax sp. LG9.2]MEB0059855.1 DUF2309 domain-containing protein [Variovorax sp. LG9.2]